MSVPTLTDVKDQLHITGSGNDKLLGVYLQSALRLIEARVGPSTVRAFTEQVEGHSHGLNLSYRPLVSITSLTALRDGQGAVDVTGLKFDARAGTLWRRDNANLIGTWEVAYTAGWATFPDNYHLATLITIQHLWRTTRGGSKRPSMGNTDDLSVTFGGQISRAVKGNTITLPAAAIELLGDSIYFGGIA